MKVEQMESEASQAEPFSAFRRLNLVLGTITSVEDHPEAERLYVLKVDVAEEEPRTIVTNIKNHYTPEKLLGSRLLIIANLKPANFRGVKSFGMIMAACDEDENDETLLLLQPSIDVPDGTVMNCGLENSDSRIKMEHFEEVVIKVAKVEGGRFMGMDVELPEGAPERIAAVIDGDRAIPLGDGKGCVMTVDGDIVDGAPVA